MKVIKKVLIVLLIVLVIIQFFRPEKNIADQPIAAFFESETQASAEIVTILESKCYDCHSNNTKYPWYAEVAPISYWIDGHIEEGKEHFNVSDWASFDIEKKEHKMEEFVEEVEEGKMPEDSYTWIHGNLSDGEKEKIIEWGKKVRLSYKREMEGK
ncbi:heme-binding domain-containing protein [Flagellimonas onchidii]|uniref:heme-binding domain-containing protein n=1 Tax=Flagellimonas onchidii TaxID=2562684 RepID=UPI0010A61791|nr:heme-binding domain-containing protein [Allomuricauda onchidii]